jgi:hypothetical protein
MEHDLPIAAGNTRLVKLTDGSEVRETYLEFVQNTRYSYRMSKMEGVLGNFLTHAEGYWNFETNATGGFDLGFLCWGFLFQ